MKISVIITTYNGSKYLIDQLESIRNQTTIPDEIIICDDCSTDDTCAIVDRYIESHNLNKWFFLKNKKNQGWKKNFHNCVSMSTGEIVFFCDQDDIWDSNKIEVMVDLFEKNPNSWAISCKTRLIDDNGIRMRDNPSTFPHNSNNSHSMKRKRMNNKFIYSIVPGCTLAIKRELINKVNYSILNKNYILPHDALYWKAAVIFGKAYIYDDALISYRIHSNNASRPTNRNSIKIKEKSTRIIEAQEIDSQLEAIKEVLADKMGDSKLFDNIISFSKKRLEYLNSNKRVSVLYFLKYFRFYNSIKMMVGDIVRRIG